MRLLQQKTQRGDFEHLVIHSSIIRPAANDFIREYVRRLHGGRWDPIHPLLDGALRRQNIVKARDLARFVGRRIRIAGLLITGKVLHTRHGDPMEFLTFEDDTGLVETVCFPEVYRRFCAVLDKSRPFILTGKVEEDFGAVTLTVSHVQPAVP